MGPKLELMNAGRIMQIYGPFHSRKCAAARVGSSENSWQQPGITMMDWLNDEIITFCFLIHFSTETARQFKFSCGTILMARDPIVVCPDWPL